MVRGILLVLRLRHTRVREVVLGMTMGKRRGMLLANVRTSRKSHGILKILAWLCLPIRREES